MTFRFAVVQVVSTFWANQMGPVLEGMLIVFLSLQLLSIRRYKYYCHVVHVAAHLPMMFGQHKLKATCVLCLLFCLIWT